MSETINVYSVDGITIIGRKDYISEIDVIDTQTCWDMLGNMIDCKDCWQCELFGDPYPCED